MSFAKCAFLFVALLAVVACLPVPDPEPGFWPKHHEHYVIHVPYKVHTVHHHHVHKVHVPIVKEIPIYKEIHYSKPISHGWW